VRRGVEKALLHRKVSAQTGVDRNVQQGSFGPSLEPTVEPTGDARPTRRSAAGASRRPRQARALDRRTTLSSLAAELSAAAATIDEPAAVAATALLELPDHPVLLDRVDESAAPGTASVLERLAMLDDDVAPVRAVVPKRPIVPAAPEVDLTGYREATPSTPTASDPTSAEALRKAVQLEVARAEADALSSRVEAELAARAAAEMRLAEAQDEIRFLRAEVQMTGHQPARPPSRLRRAWLAITGRRRPVVPANNPKKERLGV
jgi:hypothetical protein